MASEQKQWKVFLDQCLKHRIDVSEFKNLSSILASRCPISEASLLDALCDVRAGEATAGIKWDPLIPVYIDSLCKTERVGISAVLAVTLKWSSIHEGQQPASGPQEQEKQSPLSSVERKAKCYTLMTDIRVIQDVMLSVSAGNNIPRTLAEATSIFSAAVDWIQAVVGWHHRRQQTGGLMGSPDVVSLFESLGILLAALSGTTKGLDMLSSDSNSNDGIKIKLGQALSAYLPLCVEVSLPLRNRLDSLQKEFNLYGEPASKSLEISMMDGMNVNALQFEASVMDGPVLNSRAGLYVYINAMLVGRPLIDDNMLLSCLNNRYGGHYKVLIEEVITAAFDVLSNAMYRNESNRTMFVFRSFLVNKLPSFFATVLAASMVSIPMELCISNALGRLDPNTFPSFSQMFSMQSNMVLSDVRQEFLFACASHRLIPESSIERLLGENPMQTLPVGGQFIKDDLVAQIYANPERAEQLIADIEAMEGNASAIVGAITEAMHHLCNQKESMTLKTICNALSRRPQALDTILLFRSTKYVLQPLCNLLDSWHWDGDQGENQPVYDEFGSILLLVLDFKYRYDLKPYDLGISSYDSFVLKLLDRGSCSQKMEDLTEKQNRDLGAWIGALFIAEGISEDTMSNCSPQEFYLLVTTLFSQSLEACEAGKLEFETLKGGFEYLLEPFLLPSLVVALEWLGNRIWESESEPTIALKTLHSLVSPSSISGEAQAIHQTVLDMTARTLEEQVKDVRARHPSRQDIKPILDALEPYLSFQRTGSSHRSELESWTTHSGGGGGGLLGSIRNTVQSLVLWSSNPEISMAPPSYTHRQLLAGVRMLGASRVLRALEEELKLQAEAGGGGDLALDVVAMVICAPMLESFTADQQNYHPDDANNHNNHNHNNGNNAGTTTSSSGANKDHPGSTTTTTTTTPPVLQSPILTLRDALNLDHSDVPRISEKDPLRAELIVRLHRRIDHLTVPTAQVPTLDVSNILGNMSAPQPSSFDRGQPAAPTTAMDLEPSGGAGGAAAAAAGGDGSAGAGADAGAGAPGDADADADTDAAAAAAAAAGSGRDGLDDSGDLSEMLDSAAAAAAAGMQDMGEGMGPDAGAAGLDPSLDDVLNAADIAAVGNPEFLDLDMEGMF